MTEGVSTEPSEGGVFSERIDVRMTPSDIEILDWLTEFLATSRSDVVRTALRSFAGQMKHVSTDMRQRTQQT